DPYFSTSGLWIPEDYSTFQITMSATGGADQANVFFLADDEVWFSEESRVGVDIIGDGRMRTYEVDMSTAAAWNGTVTALRFDPVNAVGRTIEIDRVVLGR
ncbi:MAG: hypothetical protein HKN94_04355, partial [Acidimicrobiales bacterium]|nr:hypothetical protein [Acidimicrobiales bacterium]NND13655.1 hypothetical protein [Acidimicrobiia bacterium]